jgi:hypothetical protein
VIIGVNRDYEHGGRHYHIQAEDLGMELQCFEVRVYDAGTVLWSKRIPYEGSVPPDLPKGERQQVLQALIEKTLHTVEAAIARGRLD